MYLFCNNNLKNPKTLTFSMYLMNEEMEELNVYQEIIFPNCNMVLEATQNKTAAVSLLVTMLVYCLFAFMQDPSLLQQRRDYKKLSLVTIGSSNNSVHKI